MIYLQVIHQKSDCLIIYKHYRTTNINACQVQEILFLEEITEIHNKFNYKIMNKSRNSCYLRLFDFTVKGRSNHDWVDFVWDLLVL